jgi:hypothetical protein
MLTLRNKTFCHKFFGELATLDECFGLCLETVRYFPEFEIRRDIHNIVTKRKAENPDATLPKVIELMKKGPAINPLALNYATAFLFILHRDGCKNIKEELNKPDMVRHIASMFLPGWYKDIQNFFGYEKVLTYTDFEQVYSIFMTRMIYLLALGLDASNETNMKIFSDALLEFHIKENECFRDCPLPKSLFKINGFITDTFVEHAIVNGYVFVDSSLKRNKHFQCTLKKKGELVLDDFIWPSKCKCKGCVTFVLMSPSFLTYGRTPYIVSAFKQVSRIPLPKSKQ